MEQGIQTNFPQDNLRKEGCYFFCLLRWAELLGAPPFNTAEKITNLFDFCVKAGWAEPDCFVISPVLILNTAAGHNYFKHVYLKKELPNTVEYALAYLKKPGHGHFVLVDSTGKQIWDPLDPNRPGVSDYVVDSYRVIV